MLVTLAHLFTPHYTNNHRPKILHPSGLAILLVLFFVTQFMITVLEKTPSLPSGFVLGYASSITAGQAIELTNAERAKAGLPPLRLNGRLSEAALAKANHMFSKDYWAHVAPDGTTPWVFIRNSGYAYTVAGENLARDFNDTNSMVSAWMASPTHKDNILHKKYSEIGIAVVDGKLGGVETTLVVQMFGTPTIAAARTTSTAAQSSKPAPVVKEVKAELPKVLPTEVPAPVVTPAPEPEVVAADMPIPQSALGAHVSPSSSRPAYEVMVSPLKLTKAVGSSIITLLLMVLLYDLYAATHKKIPRSVGKNWAHLSLFSVAIVFILALSEGRIL